MHERLEQGTRLNLCEHRDLRGCTDLDAVAFGVRGILADGFHDARIARAAFGRHPVRALALDGRRLPLGGSYSNAAASAWRVGRSISPRQLGVMQPAIAGTD